MFKPKFLGRFRVESRHRKFKRQLLVIIVEFDPKKGIRYGASGNLIFTEILYYIFTEMFLHSLQEVIDNPLTGPEV